MASATPATLSTRYACYQYQSAKRKDGAHFCRAREHTLARVQAGAAGVLDLLDFRALLANHRAHARVGDHEFDGDCPTAGYGGHVERLIVNPAHNETKGLWKGKKTVNMRT